MEKLAISWKSLKKAIGANLNESLAVKDLLDVLIKFIDKLNTHKDLSILGKEGLLDEQSALTKKIVDYEADMKRQLDEGLQLKWYQFQAQKDLKNESELTWESYVKTKNELAKIRDLLKN